MDSPAGWYSQHVWTPGFIFTSASLNVNLFFWRRQEIPTDFWARNRVYLCLLEKMKNGWEEDNVKIDLRRFMRLTADVNGVG
jgi:hypothetical protein